jgi:RND family efflux transporter MFP subunit
MSLVTAALKRPITIIVLASGLLLFSFVALRNIAIDIFPKLNLPTVYVIESYGGMSPQQMEGFFATRMQDQFLYVNGIKSMTSKNIQGLTLLKLSFYENTDMAEASAQIALQVNRAMKFFPPGALPPQVIRFDASSLPVGELVFASKTKSLKEIYDLATTRVRSMFATVPGLSAPPPFGANSRSIVVSVDPDKLRSYDVSPDEVVEIIAKSNVMSPSGFLRSGNTMYITTINTLEKTVEDFSSIPLMSKNGTTVFLSDVAKVADASDITVDYALINGKRSVYIPVVKTADASTWDVVQKLKATIPEMQNLLPDDVTIHYAFDQSVFVMNAVKSLMTEGILGAILTGLMVLLFLRDWRSSLIVIITIPVSILSTVLLLKLAGQTINLMTLSGLALAIGILVDQATVTIENIHQHLEAGKGLRTAIFEACQEISFPLLLILLCILAVFAPSFMMQGVPKAMFLPLSLSIGFAMIISYLLAQTLVPILSNWLLKEEKFNYKHGRLHAHAGEAFNKEEIRQINHHLKEEMEHPEENDFFEKVKLRFIKRLDKMMRRKKQIIALYGLICIGLIALFIHLIGSDMMPRTNSGQFQLRLKEPDGTRLEQTETALKQVLEIIDSTVKGNISISSAYIGLVPSSYGTSNLYVFNSGTHEAVLQVNLNDNYKVNMDELKDALRKNIHYKLPDSRIIFEPIDLTDKIMSQGSSTPIEVRVAGKDLNQIQSYADTLVTAMSKLPYLRDVQIAQPLAFPTIAISIDRFKASQFGLTVEQIARSVTASTSSSRFTEKNQWLDEKAAYTYQVQVQVPEYVMNSMDELKEIPLIKGQNRPILSDVATMSIIKAPGEYDRNGPKRFLTVNANLYKKDLGTATSDVNSIIKKLGPPAKGITISLKGMSDLLTETLSSLQTGLLFAVVVIFLLLAANYESFKLGGIVLLTVPAVIAGSLLLLLATGSTLNLQSYMGLIMSIGVSVANAILIVSNAEKLRIEYKNSGKAAVTAASIRLRPILMTSFAMIAGMIPMASGLGEAGEQTAPLGRAVIGGLIASTFAALFILPLAFAWIQNKASLESPSLLPKLKSLKAKSSLAQLSIIFIIISAFLTSCGSKETPVDLTIKSAKSENKVEWTTVRQSELSSSIKLPAEITAFESVDIYPKVTGFVKEIFVDRGSRVHKGQVLMKLEAPEISQQVQTAKATITKAKEAYLLSKERYDRLLQTSKTPGTVSPFDLSSAQTKMQSDEASLAAEQSNLKGLMEVQNYLTVTAPFSGMITERNIHPGALVGPNTKLADKPMLVLQQLDKLRLTVHVPEDISSETGSGKVISFTVSAFPDKVFNGTIARQSGVISSNVRSEALEIDINAGNGLIKPGMYAEVRFPVKSPKNGFIVPASSIVHSTKGVYLISKDADNKTIYIPIQEGINSKDSTVVFGSLKEGMPIMLHPSAEIESGVTVE